MSFTQVHRLFIVERYTVSRSYVTCRNDFKNRFPDSLLQNGSTVSRLLNGFRDTKRVQDTNQSSRPAVLSDYSLGYILQTLLCFSHFQHLLKRCLFYFNLIFSQIKGVRDCLPDFSHHELTLCHVNVVYMNFVYLLRIYLTTSAVAQNVQQRMF
jgi:hypothetical protein